MAKLSEINVQDVQREWHKKYIEIGKRQLSKSIESQKYLKRNIFQRFRNRKKIKEQEAYIQSLSGAITGVETRPDLYVHSPVILSAPSRWEEPLLKNMTDSINRDYQEKIQKCVGKVTLENFERTYQEYRGYEIDLSNFKTFNFMKNYEFPAVSEAIDPEMWKGYVLDTEYGFDMRNGDFYALATTKEYPDREVEQYIEDVSNYNQTNNIAYLETAEALKESFSSDTLKKINEYTDACLSDFKEKVKRFSFELVDLTFANEQIDKLSDQLKISPEEIFKHEIQEKAFLSVKEEQEEPVLEHSDIYQLGGDYKLGLEGDVFLEKGNTIEIFEVTDDSVGYNRDVLAKIHDLPKTDAKEIMANPFDANLEYYTVTVGESGTIQNVDSLSDVLVTIGELSNNPRIPENIALHFSAAGKDEITDDIQRSIDKHEKGIAVVNQINQLTDDQRTVIDLSIGQEFLSEEMSRISEGIVEEEGWKSYFDDQQQNTSGVSRSISSSENRFQKFEKQQDSLNTELQTVKDRLDPEQKQEVDSLIDSVHYEVLNELMEQAAIKRTKNNVEIVEEVELEEDCSMSM